MRIVPHNCKKPAVQATDRSLFAVGNAIEKKEMILIIFAIVVTIAASKCNYYKRCIGPECEYIPPNYCIGSSTGSQQQSIFYSCAYGGTQIHVYKYSETANCTGPENGNGVISQGFECNATDCGLIVRQYDECTINQQTPFQDLAYITNLCETGVNTAKENEMVMCSNTTGFTQTYYGASDTTCNGNSVKTNKTDWGCDTKTNTYNKLLNCDGP